MSEVHHFATARGSERRPTGAMSLLRSCTTCKQTTNSKIKQGPSDAAQSWKFNSNNKFFAQTSNSEFFLLKWVPRASEHTSVCSHMLQNVKINDSLAYERHCQSKKKKKSGFIGHMRLLNSHLTKNNADKYLPTTNCESDITGCKSINEAVITVSMYLTTPIWWQTDKQHLSPCIDICQRAFCSDVLFEIKVTTLFHGTSCCKNYVICGCFLFFKL